MPVIKANAYGHSATLIAQILESTFAANEMPYLVVARAGEAQSLRADGVRRPLLVLSQFESDDLKTWPAETDVVVSCADDVARLLGGSGARPRVHLNLNSGMNRLGFRWDRDGGSAMTAAAERLHAAGFSIAGLMSHLARGEDEAEVLSSLQRTRFEALVADLRSRWNAKTMGTFPTWIHLANSGGTARGVRSGNALRPGVLLWGVCPSLAHRATFAELGLKPVARVQAPVRQAFWTEAGEGIGYGHRYVAPRRTLVGTVCLGYADGLPRLFSRSAETPDNRAALYVGGVRCPILGIVSMDLTMIDLTDHPRRAEWEASVATCPPAVWIGPEQNAESIAAAAGTIPYEILCALSHRLPRRRVDAGAPRAEAR